MPRELTRDEFIRIFGTTPENYEAKHPTRVRSVTSQQPKRDLYSDPAVVGAVKQSEDAFRGIQTQDDSDVDTGNGTEGLNDEQVRVPPYKSDMRKLIEGTGREMTPVESFLDSIDSPLEHGSKNLVAGALAVPSSVGGVVDVARFGAPAVVKGVMSGDNKGVVSRIADEFMNGVLPKESIEALEQAQMSAIDQFKQENPHASANDVSAFAKKYVDSDEFYERTLDALPLGLRVALKGQNWANRTAGLDRRADQMSAGDDAMQIAGGAVVGLPGSVVSKITRPVVKALGERVANNLATKLAARAVEAITPMTFPLTPGNVALNAGVGVGLNEAIRSATGQDTLIDYNNLYDPDKLPAPESVAAATGLSAAAIFGLPSLTKIVQGQAAATTKAAIKRIGQSAGPTLEEQSSRLKPQLSPLRGLIDQNAPVKAGITKFGGTQEDQQLADAALSAAATVNRSEAENNALNYGILEGLGRNTTPYTEIRSIYDRFDPATKDMFDKYVYAVQRKQDSTAYEKSLVQQVRHAQTDLQAAQMSGHKGRIQKAQNKLIEVQQKYTALQQDDPSSRSSMVNWTKSDVDDYIRAGNQNPAVKQVADAVRKVSNDLVEYLQKNGIIDSEEAARRLNTRDLYVKLQERRHADAGPLKRRALLFADKFKQADSDQGFFISTAARDVSGEGSKVNNPKTAIVAVQEGIMDAVRSVAANNARRDVIDKLASLPNARGTLLRPYEFNLGNGRKVTSISPSQYQTIYPRGIEHEDDYIKIFRNGKIELWEFGDKSITKSLQFAPLAAVPIMNAMRKFWQGGTTGLRAPWFAAKTFAWDAPLAQTTKEAGRSLGLVDTLGRRLAQGTVLERPVNEYMDRFGAVPGLQMLDAYAATGAAIPYQMGLRAMRAVGDKVAIDLATGSGVFNAIAKAGPRGQAFVQGIGRLGAAAFDSSALNIMSRNMSTSLSHLNDVSRIGDDYMKAALKHTGPLKTALNGYKAILESVHMATKTAFFASNYGRLKAQYGNNIPAKEIKKLVQETRNLTGDMSRQSNSKAVQKLTSVIPYSNAMIQGTRHLLSSAVPQPVAKAVNSVGGNMLTDRNTRFWSQFASGVMLPIIGSASILASWEGAEDYWYNRTPKWKQISAIPLPNVAAVEYLFDHGEWPPFDPKYVNEVPTSPEFALIAEPAKAMLRGMGVLGSGPNKLPGQYSQQIKDVLDQVTSFATPPVISSLFAMNGQRFDLHGALTLQGAARDNPTIPGGGANADMMTTNSDIPQVVYDTIGTIAGASAQIAMQSWNVYDISRDEHKKFGDALDAAWDTGSFEVKRRFPAIDVPGLYNARQRMYQSTPESEYVYKTENDLEPIIGGGRQMSVEADSKGNSDRQAALGLITAQKIRDPNLKSLSQFVYDSLMKKGAYKDAKQASSTIRRDLAALEASRYKAPDDKYNTVRNNMIRKIQEETRIQSHELQTLERSLQKTLGRRFIQQYGVPFSFKALSELVRKDVAQ